MVSPQRQQRDFCLTSNSFLNHHWFMPRVFAWKKQYLSANGPDFNIAASPSNIFPLAPVQFHGHPATVRKYRSSMLVQLPLASRSDSWTDWGFVLLSGPEVLRKLIFIWPRCWVMRPCRASPATVSIRRFGEHLQQAFGWLLLLKWLWFDRMMFWLNGNLPA